MTESILALGLMSGTSMDGADAALIRGDGVEVAPLGGAAVAYSDAERAALKRAAADAAAAGPAARAEDFTEAAAIVASRAAEAAEAAIQDAGAGRPVLLGFHGQTLFHAPEHRFTLQVGDAQALADAVGAPVIRDFRAADVAAGGQGAPFAPFYHWALARRAGVAGAAMALNLGGVANVTWIDPAAEDPAAPGALLAWDTGPASALLDDLMAARLGARFDADGALAAAGQADDDRVARWIAETPFFALAPPKAIDRDLFSARLAELDDLADADAAATLAAFTVETVAKAASQAPCPAEVWAVTGGGRRNRSLMAGLAARLAPTPVRPIEAWGVDGDLVEAQAFAHLAIRAAAGRPLSAPGTTGVPRPLTGGRRVTPARRL